MFAVGLITFCTMWVQSQLPLPSTPYYLRKKVWGMTGVKGAFNQRELLLNIFLFGIGGRL